MIVCYAIIVDPLRNTEIAFLKHVIQNGERIVRGNTCFQSDIALFLQKEKGARTIRTVVGNENRSTRFGGIEIGFRYVLTIDCERFVVNCANGNDIRIVASEFNTPAEFLQEFDAIDTHIDVLVISNVSHTGNNLCFFPKGKGNVKKCLLKMYEYFNKYGLGKRTF